MGNLVGIDLGTSTSEIAVLENGSPRLIPNHLGELITPSVVHITKEGEIIVGNEAKEMLILDPNSTAMEVKRLIGSGETVTIRGKQMSPELLSSYILKYLIKSAEEYLGDKIDRAVITVPAYFSDEQRRATVQAGKLAGVVVERILNEPTAAAMDYGLLHMEECNHILIYDLGGGTFDVTLLELFDGVIEVKASCGNNKLGGKDFDQAIIDYVSDKFKTTYGRDILSDPRAYMRLKNEAENCKIALSSDESYTISLPFITTIKGDAVSIDETITRELFISLIDGKIISTKEQIMIALEDSDLKIEDIDICLLVGGSTKIPYVKDFISDFLGKVPMTLVDPDLAVVRGAAVQSGIIDDTLGEKNSLIVTDVCPYTLGTAVVSHYAFLPNLVFDELIHRNTTIPVTVERIYCTVADMQTKVLVEVYQGNYKDLNRNNFLNEFELSGIPPAPSGNEKIKISFSYDVNGILQVTAIIVSTGKSASIEIATTGVTMVDEIDVSNWKNSKRSKKYRPLISRCEKILSADLSDDPIILDLADLVNDLKEALVLNKDKSDLDEIKEEIVELLYEWDDEQDDD